ncbi:MAG TPA: pyridoxamine 5'-phosphate oxidase family protein [Gemmatimonadales bacterium]|jgi:nitroimidazol reductase NimA-like FMN-containing flavoprotein (pyridoxamine 5'-phosphate oxidase superfamily)|nr:pyridoxamine 5'-phosphate oxidase family protein [Gemmatimonadales bacterium]
MSAKATFRDLSEQECRELLARHHVGRIAYQIKDYVNIVPLGYVYHGDWLACRTQEGSKVSVLRQSPYVAFEVDEVEGLFDWKSVVVQGSWYEEDRPTSGREETLAALRAVAPSVLTPEDPTPFRDILFRIHIREITGRAATTKS